MQLSNKKTSTIKHILKIKDFGPIRDANLNINDFTILIGPQASGKSTISKLIYFFLNVRDELVDFIEDLVDGSENRFNWTSFNKLLNQRMLDFFSTSPRTLDMRIVYTYTNGISITATRNETNLYLYWDCSNSLVEGINKLYASHFKNLTKQNTSNSIFDSITQRERRTATTKLRVELSKLLNFNNELLYIPAGRSLLSALAGQLQDIHPHNFDYPIRRFIERVNLNKKNFGKSLIEIVEEYTETRSIKPDEKKINPIIEIIKQILKGEYRDHIDGGRLYSDKEGFIKINFASSGQQESLWILLLLFLVALENAQAYIFIEEPEAHLYPFAQRDIITLISQLHSQYNNRIFITTHSPYILAAVNDHIYAGKLGELKPNEVSQIMSESEWVHPSKVDGYLVDNGTVENIFDTELSMFKTEILDRVSADINGIYDKLMELDDVAE